MWTDLVKSGAVVSFEMSAAREPFVAGRAIVGFGPFALAPLPTLRLWSCGRSDGRRGLTHRPTTPRN
jgi:hypothetical protein